MRTIPPEDRKNRPTCCDRPMRVHQRRVDGSIARYSCGQCKKIVPVKRLADLAFEKISSAEASRRYRERHRSPDQKKREILYVLCDDSKRDPETKSLNPDCFVGRTVSNSKQNASRNTPYSAIPYSSLSKRQKQWADKTSLLIDEAEK